MAFLGDDGDTGLRRAGGHVVPVPRPYVILARPGGEVATVTLLTLLVQNAEGLRPVRRVRGVVVERAVLGLGGVHDVGPSSIGPDLRDVTRP